MSKQQMEAEVQGEEAESVQAAGKLRVRPEREACLCTAAPAADGSRGVGQEIPTHCAGHRQAERCEDEPPAAGHPFQPTDSWLSQSPHGTSGLPALSPMPIPPFAASAAE